MTKRLVELPGGRIWGEGNSGGGAILVVTLPVSSIPDAGMAA
jgi:signal transduction histidine kinase